MNKYTYWLEISRGFNLHFAYILKKMNTENFQA